jgi:hypothetical protein
VYRPPLGLRLLTSALLVLRAVALKLGDGVWLAFLRVLVALPLPADIRSVARELLDILQDGPPGTVLLRRMVAGTKREELQDMLWGVLWFDDEVAP